MSFRILTSSSELRKKRSRVYPICTCYKTKTRTVVQPLNTCMKEKIERFPPGSVTIYLLEGTQSIVFRSGRSARLISLSPRSCFRTFEPFRVADVFLIYDFSACAGDISSPQIRSSCSFPRLIGNFIALAACDGNLLPIGRSCIPNSHTQGFRIQPTIGLVSKR